MTTTGNMEGGAGTERRQLVMYYNRTNAERGENPWVVMRMFIGGFSHAVFGQVVRSFRSSSEAFLFVRAILGEEDVRATLSWDYPDAWVASKRTLYRVVEGDDGPVLDVSDGLDSMLRMPFELR